MTGRGLLRLFLLFGFLSYWAELVKARSNLLHDGVIDSLGYDPSILSLLQMEQSLDLDDEDAAYLGASLLEKGPSLLEHSSRHLGPSYSGKDWDEDSFLEEVEEEDEDEADENDESLLESESSSSSESSDKDWESWSSPSYLETGSSQEKVLSPKSFSSMIQLHNFELDPLNFLQDDSVLLVGEDEQDNGDFDMEVGRKPNLTAYVLKGDPYERQAEEANSSFDFTNGQQLLSLLKAYRFWLVFLVVLLVIAFVVRLYYLEKFLKFKTELWAKLDALNQSVVAKVNGVFNKNKGSAESGDTSPLLSA